MKLKSDEMISQVIRIDDSSHEIPGMAVIGQYSLCRSISVSFAFLHFCKLAVNISSSGFSVFM
jgi:hypothetical protein